MDSLPGKIKRGPLFYIRLVFQNEAFLSDVLCGCIVAGCSFLYLQYVLTHTLVHANSWPRQYLIANHIARFWEFPSVGDELSVFYSLRVTSPVYYYLFGFVLWLHNSMLFAQVVWLLWAMLAIVCVYLIAKDLFSPGVGVFACALFGLSFAYAWPLSIAPNISAGQALLYFSFLMLARAHSRKDFALLLWAVATYCVASVMYSGGFGVLPVFAALAVITLKTQGAPAKRYVGSLALAGVTLLAAYLPLVIHAYHSHAALLEPTLADRLVRSPRLFLKNLAAHTIYATDSLFLVATRAPVLPPLSDYAALARQLFLRNQAVAGVRVSTHGEAASLILGSLAGASIIAYFRSKAISRERKRHAAFLACSIATLLISASVFNFIYHATWHYMAIEGLLCILIAEAVHGVCTGSRVPRAVEFLFGGFLVWCCAGGFAGISIFVDRSSPKSASSAEAAGAAMVRETKALRQALAEADFRPQITSYEGKDESPNGVPYLWTYMENTFNEPFVRLTDNLSYSVAHWYEPLGDDRYLFVVCPRQGEASNCREVFSAQHRQYAVIKDIIANDAYDIILAKRL